MKIITLFWILLFASFLFGMIGKIIKKEKFRLWDDHASFYDKWFFAGYLIFFWAIIFVNERYDYDASALRKTREEYSIPALEQNMELVKRTKSKEIWQNIKTDTSFFHEFKVIDIDLSHVFKEVDYYKNTEKNQVLIIENYIPGFFRKHKVNYYIKDIQGDYQLTRRNATKIENDSVQSWWINN